LFPELSDAQQREVSMAAPKLDGLLSSTLTKRFKVYFEMFTLVLHPISIRNETKQRQFKAKRVVT